MRAVDTPSNTVMPAPFAGIHVFGARRFKTAGQTRP
jgi:hypothetical protein